MTRVPDERNAEMQELFFETSQELLQSLNEEALKLEKNAGDHECVRSIRRIVHTLKGDAAACGFRELSQTAHVLEDALALESALLSGSLVEIAFIAADTFAAMVAAYQRKTKLPSTDSLRKMLRKLAQVPKAEKPSKKRAVTTAKTTASTAAPIWTEYEKLAIQNACVTGKHVFHIAATIDPHCAMPIAARQLLLNALEGWGEVLATRPEAGSQKPGKKLEVLLATTKTAEQLSARCRIPTVMLPEVSVKVVASPDSQDKKTSPQTDLKPTEGSQFPAETEPVLAVTDHPEPAHVTTDNVLRVDAERIDNVLDLVGELILGKSMLQQAFHELAQRFPKEVMRGRFIDAMAFQARVLSDLQRSVMKIRMVPVEQLFRRFPRLVRDVAKQCGKDVELAVSGQDTDLDKRLLDGIAEPLTHIVRNAVSHGIENSQERTLAGKPARGRIQLTSYHQGNQVIIEISDDGRGIDSQKVKAKAVEKGLATVEEANRLSQAEILDFVFRPGFSTAEEVTEIAGRGVGLDVVRSVLQRLKGSAEIETQSGKSTTFRLKLPLTLAIIKALLFRIGQRLYAIPLNAVAEIARTTESDLHLVDQHEVLQLRDRVLPLIRLGSSPAGEGQAAQKIFVLVISMGERKLGLIVDSLVGEEELVIKALDDRSISTDLISGASVLGDGRVVLIVNLPAVIERHARSRPHQAGTVASGFLLPTADQHQLPQFKGEMPS
jgi:two-component system, chemotaxis family, sensor kinase CheA